MIVACPDGLTCDMRSDCPHALPHKEQKYESPYRPPLGTYCVGIRGPAIRVPGHICPGCITPTLRHYVELAASKGVKS